jgi:DNA polymerase/3'-5' exonuclease PolX
MSAATDRIPLAQAQAIADEVVAQLRPHCEQIDIAGSIRRRRPTIGDIEIVCIPKPYDATPLFRTGLALVVEQWEKVKGELPCKYSQRLLPSGMKLDLFMPDPRGYGLALAIRTGSAEWSHHVLAAGWVKAGFRSEGGLLRDLRGQGVRLRTERAVFDLIGLPWVPPEEREWKGGVQP